MYLLSFQGRFLLIHVLILGFTAFIFCNIWDLLPLDSSLLRRSLRLLIGIWLVQVVHFLRMLRALSFWCLESLIYNFYPLFCIFVSTITWLACPSPPFPLFIMEESCAFCASYVSFLTLLVARGVLLDGVTLFYPSLLLFILCGCTSVDGFCQEILASFLQI